MKITGSHLEHPLMHGRDDFRNCDRYTSGIRRRDAVY